jgi:hypothetical protein
MEIPSVNPTIKKASNTMHKEEIIPNVNQENTTSTIREIIL